MELFGLRPAAAKDAEVVSAWFHTHEEALEWAGETPWPLTPAWLAREIMTPDERYFALTRNDAPVGFFGLRIHPDRVHLIRVAIEPAHRGLGLSATLLEAALAAAESLGAPFVTLLVLAHDEPAVRAYERADFAYIRAQSDRRRPDWRIWLMGRPVTEAA